MKIAYLIIAHNTPNHMRRLIKSLSSPSSSFFIHLDKKANGAEYFSIKGDNINFTQERVPVFWGDFSLVDAILIVLKTALADKRKFDRFVLLSGADFPLRSAWHIEQFFQINKDKEYMNVVPMSSVGAGKPISRLTTYKTRPGDGIIINFLKKMLIRVGIFPHKRNYKKYLRDFSPYGGSTWWALSREASNYILTFVHKNPQVVNFFKNTHIPDESLFQTILGNSRFRTRIVRSLTYADWSSGGPNPAIISEKHLAFFKSTTSFAADSLFCRGEMLFARKFSEESEDLVQKLEDQIREKGND